MNITIISHKEIWLDKSSDTGFVTTGGFPFQISAISELFDSTRLVALHRKKTIQGDLTNIHGKNIIVRSLPEPLGKGIFRKLYLIIWLPLHIKTLWNEITHADIIHAAIPGDLGTIGMILSLLKRKRLFIRHCGTWGNTTTLTDRFINWLLPLIAKDDTLVLATGGGDSFPCSKNSNIKWIFSTTLAKQAWYNITQPKPWNEKRTLRLVSVGRLSKDKNTIALIKVLRLIKNDVPDIHLDIIGDGPEMKKMLPLAHDYDLINLITFHGNLSNSKVIKILSNSDIFLFPTKTKEGFPKVLVEAMACGLPIIASRVSVIPYLIEDQCGIVLRDSRIESIADAVLTMISRPDKMEEMGKKGRIISKDYTLENWQARIKTLLNDSVFKN